MAPPRALAEFVAEATEILESLGKDLLVLDQQRGQEPDPERLNAIFRAAHSLKGLSSMFGVDGLSGLAHRAEDMLDGLRLGRVSLDDAVVDTLVETLDVLQAQLAEAAGASFRPDTRVRAEEVGQRLAQLARGRPGEGPVVSLDQLDPAIRSVLTEYEEHRLSENLRKGISVWKVRSVFSLTDFDVKLAELTQALRALGEVVSTLPSSQPGEEATIAFDLIFGSGRGGEELQRAAGTLGVVSPLLKVNLPRPSAPSAWGDRTGSGITAVPETTSGVRMDTTLRSLTQTVRVDIARLDALMQSVGELLLIGGSISRLAESARGGGGSAPWSQSLARETRALERKLEELQVGILDARMVPLGQVFDKLARLMRRLVRDSGKDVVFEAVGADVELDKLIVEELSDPLMHLLRNALDHGIERPAVRELAGKPATGTVRLAARQQGNHVVIEVIDDGAGMDEVRIRSVAVERGLVTAAAASDMDRRDLLNLVFLPGFSTRQDVSELSGRGVGLDVVKTNLARLSGVIDIDSRRGRGTTFTLTLPLTLAIIRALMVLVSGRTYAIPLNSVLEIVQLQPPALSTIEHREVVEVRGQTLPFVRLAKVFGIPHERRSDGFVIVVGLAQQRVAFAVDALLGQSDVVTKPLSGRLKEVRGVAGATEVAERRTVLVLDVGALVEEVLS